MHGPTFIKFGPGWGWRARLCQEIPVQIASFISQKHMFKVKPCRTINCHCYCENGRARKIKTLFQEEHKVIFMIVWHEISTVKVVLAVNSVNNDN